MPDHSIRVEQVMELEGRSRAWVFEHAERLGAHRNGVVGRNGKPVTLYDIRRCSPEAYRKWELQKAAVPLLPTENSSPEETSPAQLAMEMTIPGGPRMSAADREVVNFRFQVIEPLVDRRKHWQIWRFCSDSAVEVVKHQAARHKRTVHKTGEQRPLSWRTVYDWWQRYRGQKFSDRSGLEALVDRSRRDKGCKRKLNEAGQDFIVAMVLPFWDGKDGYGELSAADVHAAYNEELAWREEHAGTVLQAEDRKRLKKYCSPIGRLSKSALLPHIHYETVRKVIAALPKSLLVRARSGPERFEATQVAYSYRAIEKLAPMEYVVMDHRRADLFCAVRSGKGETGGWELIRPWITAAIDMRTRKWLGWRIVRTPSAGSIASVMKRVFLDHGLPQSFYWDNGQDFECFWLDGVLKDLGIPVTHAKVKNARAKVIEPNFKPLAAWERTTPWWGGHKPSARPERLADRVREFEQ